MSQPSCVCPNQRLTDIYSKRYVPESGVTLEEGWLLYSFVRVVQPEIVVETGRWKGLSLLWVAQALRDNDKAAKLYSFEPRPQGDNYYKDQSWVYEYLFEMNCSSYGDDAIALSGQLKEKIGLAFIDGDHTGEGVKHDFLLWLMGLREGGVGVLHDATRSAKGLCVWSMTLSFLEGTWREFGTNVFEVLTFPHEMGYKSGGPHDNGLCIIRKAVSLV